MPFPELELIPRQRERASTYQIIDAVRVLNPGEETPTNFFALNDSQLQSHRLMSDTLSCLIKAGKEGKSSQHIASLYHDEVRHQWLPIAHAERPGMASSIINGLHEEGDRQRKFASDHYKSMRHNGLGALGLATAAGVEGVAMSYNLLRAADATETAGYGVNAINATTLGLMFGMGSTVMTSRSLCSLKSGVTSSLVAYRLAGAAKLLRESWQTHV